MKFLFMVYSLLVTTKLFAGVYNIHTQSIPHSGKPVICTMTINSSDEKKVFIQKFQNSVDVVELVPNKALSSQYSHEDAPSEGWLGESCDLLEQNQVNCDVLILSGHFGGHFFGASGKKLTLDKLEKYSCNNSCPRLFNKLKTTYLFGCNTLADKTKDKRTPDEYLRVLLSDGFSRTQAEQVVNFRYGATGDSFHDRMVRVFDHSPKVYGFSSVSPAGSVLAPFLRNYLQHSSFSDVIASDKDGLTNYLGSKNLVLQAGLPKNETERKLKSYTCRLSNEELSPSARLKFSIPLLQGSDRLLYLPQIIKLYYSLDGLNEVDRSSISQIMQNQNLKDDVIRLLKTSLPPTLKLEWSLFAVKMKWIDRFFYTQEVKKGLVGLLAPPYSQESIEEFQFYLKKFPGFLAVISADDIPSSFFLHEYFYRQFNHLSNLNPKLISKFCQMAAESSDVGVKIEASNILKGILPTTSSCLSLMPKLLSSNFAEIRTMARDVLIHSETQDLSLQLKILPSLSHHNGDLRWNAFEALVGLRPKDAQVLRALRVGLHDSNQDIRELVETYLRRFR